MFVHSVLAFAFVIFKDFFQLKNLFYVYCFIPPMFNPGMGFTSSVCLALRDK